MADRATLVQNLRKALADVTETVTKAETLVSQLPSVISTEEMDTFMELGDTLDEQCITLVDVMSDAVWDFAEENDEIDLMKYE